tara:strand:- start:2102 stop:2470 length:369 start_codon:yes stop_codon:yes gene_type:complete
MNTIHVTKNAWNKMSHIINLSKNKYGFIYSASSGGCNGFNFELNLLEKELHKEIIKKKFYTVLKEDTTKLYIDPISEMYLLGTTIDYIHEDYKNNIYESKFQFKINKDNMTSCGCGISFSPK